MGNGKTRTFLPWLYHAHPERSLVICSNIDNMERWDRWEHIITRRLGWAMHNKGLWVLMSCPLNSHCAKMFCCDQIPRHTGLESASSAFRVDTATVLFRYVQHPHVMRECWKETCKEDVADVTHDLQCWYVMGLHPLLKAERMQVRLTWTKDLIASKDLATSGYIVLLVITLTSTFVPANSHEYMTFLYILQRVSLNHW